MVLRSKIDIVLSSFLSNNIEYVTMKIIKIPKKLEKGDVEFEIDKNMVIVGANGAGKTRFGSRVEQLNPNSKRISAQRYLEIREAVPIQSYSSAKSKLDSSYKNKSPSLPQNDIQQVLVSLFAQEAKRDKDCVKSAQEKKVPLSQVPKSAKDSVLEIWKFVFPYRELKLDDDKIRADDFSGTEMSDGEKVGLYLIAHVLLAEKESTIIIDEPELHFHKALMVRLWNKLEEYRSDCTFIYITHDLSFAVSKPSSKIVWVQNYSTDGIWEWKEITPNGIIPEDLYLEMLGSREDILFVEGDGSSLDTQIYQAYYENFTVIPRESAEKVIESVKGLRENKELHDKSIYGIIDRDFKSDEHLAKLLEQGIYSTVLNKVENLFLIPEIIDLVCEYQMQQAKKDEVIEEIRKKYEEHKEQIVFKASKYRMQSVLDNEFGAVRSEEQYKVFKDTILEKLDDVSFSPEMPKKEDPIDEILGVYPNKGLIFEIQKKINLTGNGYRSLVVGFLASNRRDEVKSILSKYLPEIGDK